MNLLTPSPKLVKAARERAQEEADKRGIPIDRISIMATPWGSMKVIVLDEDTC
jgi:hypothetical protein